MRVMWNLSFLLPSGKLACSAKINEIEYATLRPIPIIQHTQRIYSRRSIMKNKVDHNLTCIHSVGRARAKLEIHVYVITFRAWLKVQRY